MLELWDGMRKNDKHLISHMDLHKTNNKLVNAYLKHDALLGPGVNPLEGSPM
jgi:hypothetical protein